MAIYLAKNSIQGIETNILSAESPDTEEQLNLFSGLKIRTPKASQTGFFINRSGTILTSSKIVENCQKITLDMDIELDIVATDKGIAVLKPKTILSPLDYLKFSRSYTKLNSRVFASGFSYEGALGTPSMNTGTLVNTRGLKREKHLQQLLIQTEKGDYGAGVLSATGAVIGLLLHYDIENKEIPKSTAFSVKSSFIRKLLKKQRIEFDLSTEVTPLSVEKISKLAEDSSALISCW
jgi:S1-C subfamily serine protease